MRGRTFNRAALARAAAIAVMGALLVAAAVRLARTGKGEETPLRPPPAVASDARLRCQGLGLAAEHDAACLDLWARDRARFLGAPTTERRP